MKTLYKQIKIQYDSSAFEICWIPEHFSAIGRKIIVGKYRGTGKLGTVIEAYPGHYSKDAIEINQTFPLWKVTDI